MINSNIREPVFAGRFYEGNSARLKNQLNQLFDDAGKIEFLGDFSRNSLQALIVPHAGYVFSGKIAASAYRFLNRDKRYKRIFILASSHRYSFNGVAVYDIGNYSSPLGEIKTDKQLATELTEKSPLFIVHPGAHEAEHSIEVQLPFLQYVLGDDFTLVPLVIGTHNPATCHEIAEILKPWFSPENLFVISTDFSHYPNYSDACETDKKTADAICSNQPEKLISTINSKENKHIDGLATSLCGWTSVLTLLYLTQGKSNSYHEIAYQNSGDAPFYGEKKRVVGYWAIAVTENKTELVIDKSEKVELLKKARNAISFLVKTDKRGKIQPPETHGILNEKAGVFVSIYIEGKLRGCIGGFAGDQTLNEMVQRLAPSSACDKRFEPVREDELAEMQLEISVLSTLKKIDSADEIVLGKHGIYIEQGHNSGTFLPQVATKTGWSLEEFLGHCARDKAGIGWNGWKTAEIFTYEAVIIKE